MPEAARAWQQATDPERAAQSVQQLWAHGSMRTSDRLLQECALETAPHRALHAACALALKLWQRMRPVANGAPEVDEDDGENDADQFSARNL